MLYLWRVWLGGKSKDSQRVYKIALEGFRAHLANIGFGQGDTDLPVFLWGFTRLDIREARMLYDSWRSAMLGVSACLASNTILQRLTVLRSYVNKANEYGHCSWTLPKPNVTTEPYRDTAGPEVNEIETLMQVAANQKNATKAARDVALLSLLFDCAFRRSEVTGIRMGDVGLDAGEHGTVSVLRKKRREKTPRPLSHECKVALEAYLEHRVPGDPGDHLFRSLGSGGREPGPLSPDGLHSIVGALGKKAKMGRLTPRMLRHTATTGACSRQG